MTTPDKSSDEPIAVISGRAIAARRKELGFSQASLAADLGVAQSTVGDWERGATRPRPNLWFKLAAVLRTKVDRLMPDLINSQVSDIVPAASLKFDKSMLQHAFVFAWQEIDKLRSDYRNFFEFHSLHFGGFGKVEGDKETGLTAFTICLEALEIDDGRPLTTIVLDLVQAHRKKLTDFLETLKASGTFD